MDRDRKESLAPQFRGHSHYASKVTGDPSVVCVSLVMRLSSICGPRLQVFHLTIMKIILLHPQKLHPGRLTWNLQITHLERKMIFQTSMIMLCSILIFRGVSAGTPKWRLGKMLFLSKRVMFRFHESVWGCRLLNREGYSHQTY